MWLYFARTCSSLQCQICKYEYQSFPTALLFQSCSLQSIWASFEMHLKGADAVSFLLNLVQTLTQLANMNCCKQPLEVWIFFYNFLEFLSPEATATKLQVSAPERGERQKPLFQQLHPIFHHYTRTITNTICLDAVCIIRHSKFCLVKLEHVYLRSGFTLCGPSVAIALKHKRKLISRQSHFVLTASFSCAVTCSGTCFYMQVYTCIYTQKMQWEF